MNICLLSCFLALATSEPPIKDTLKEDKPPNKGQAKCTIVYTLNPLKEDNLPTKDKLMVGPKCVLIRGGSTVVASYLKRPCIIDATLLPHKIQIHTQSKYNPGRILVISTCWPYYS